VIDYTQEDFTVNGKSYDLVFDTVGKRSFSECQGSLTDEGIYLATVPTPEIMLQALWTAQRGSKKVKFAATGLRPSSARIKDLVFLTELIDAGKIRPIIDRCYLLEQIVEVSMPGYFWVSRTFCDAEKGELWGSPALFVISG
jgi:NADPH:quinone reductase-like Zn-dependent oxidoreductase